MNLRNAAKLCFWALIGLTIFSQESPVGVARAQEQDNVPKASPEMQHLQKLYLGTWDFTETYGKTSFSPNGGSDVGVYTSEPGPGGNSILNRFHSKGSVGEFEGMLVMTWDPKDKAYKSYVFGNAFPGCVTQTGQFEGEDGEIRHFLHRRRSHHQVAIVSVATALDHSEIVTLFGSDVAQAGTTAHDVHDYAG